MSEETGHTNSMEQLVSEEIANFISSLPKWTESDCSLLNAGNFLIDSLELISRLSHRLVLSEEAEGFVEEQVRTIVGQDASAGIELIDYMSDKHASLK